jgi:hypothetical protein
MDAGRGSAVATSALNGSKQAKDESDNPQVRDDDGSRVWGTFLVDPVTSGAVHVRRVHTTLL